MIEPIDKQTVLIVDDTPDNIQLLSALLRDQYRTKVAINGFKALEIAATAPRPDLILMDVMMPEMDGYETTQKIRREHKNSSLPIIAVTAKAMKGDRQKCIEAGASDYITKPLKIDQLLSLMRMWFYK